MKKIILLLFLFIVSFAHAEEDARYELGNYEIKGDSIYMEDGDVYALEDFYVDHPELRNYIDGKEKLKKEIENDKKEKEESSNFMNSWKFYLLVFIFPILLLFFVILFFKTRKKN